MRKLINMELPDRNTINFDDISEVTPIIAMKNNELAGVVVKEPEGWILRLHDKYASNGYHATRRECVLSCLQYGYEFYIL